MFWIFHFCHLALCRKLKSSWYVQGMRTLQAVFLWVLERIDGRLQGKICIFPPFHATVNTYPSIWKSFGHQIKAFFIEALAQWMKFIIIFVPSRNVISRSHVVILLALFHVDYDCAFGIKNVIIFHQTHKKTFIWYTKWVLISMWGGPARSSVANSGYL